MLYEDNIIINLKKKIYNFLFILFSYLIFIIDYIIPKKNNLVIFAQKNKLFSDNSKALFKYLILNNPELEVIWLVDTKKEVKKFHNKYNFTNVEKIWTKKGLSKLLKARFVVISNSLHDFFPYYKTSSKKEVLQLWHGINWSKKFEYPNNNFTKNITVACASSKENKKIMSKMNKFSLKKIFITGLPRNDILFNKQKIKLPNKINKYKKKKFLLYAPTHKENLISDFFPFKDKNLVYLNNFLKKKKLVLFIRPHINDSNKLKNIGLNNFFLKNYSNIKKLTFNDLQDINEFLPFTKILITDYSTIYADAQLLNIPTIFIPYDLKEYIKKRGLIYKYENVAIGDKVLNQSDFIKSINKILNGNLNKEKEINKFKEKFHFYRDGHSSFRVAKIIMKKFKALQDK